MAISQAARIKNKVTGEGSMFGGAAAFFGIALVAALMGYSGFAAMFVNIAWILFLFGLVFAALFSIYGQATRRSPERDRAADGERA